MILKTITNQSWVSASTAYKYIWYTDYFHSLLTGMLHDYWSIHGFTFPFRRINNKISRELTWQLLVLHFVQHCPRPRCQSHGIPLDREMPLNASWDLHLDPDSGKRTTFPCTFACACSASPSLWPGSWSVTCPCWCQPTLQDVTHKYDELWPSPGQDHP